MYAIRSYYGITVYGMAGNSTATDRPLVISDGTTELFNEVILGDALQKKVYDYSGGAGNLYIYSGNSGINLYVITSYSIHYTKLYDSLKFRGFW